MSRKAMLQELPDDTRDYEGQMKELTGGNWMWARSLSYKPHDDKLPEFRMILTRPIPSNDDPEFYFFDRT